MSARPFVFTGLVAASLAVFATPATAASVGYGSTGDIVYTSQSRADSIVVDWDSLHGELWTRIIEIGRTPRASVDLRRGCQNQRPAGYHTDVSPPRGVTAPAPRGREVFCKFPERRSAASRRRWRSIAERVLEVHLGSRDDVAIFDLDEDTIVAAAGGQGYDSLNGGEERDLFCAGAFIGTRCTNTPDNASDDPSMLARPFDWLGGGEGDDVLSGTDGPDLLQGGPGDDNLIGRGGDDGLIGNSGDDVLNGGAGADQIDTSLVVNRREAQDSWVAGSDDITGGTGFDTYGFQFTNAPVTATGSQTTRGSTAGREVDRYSEIEILQLSGSNDTFQGPSSPLRVYGYGGDDRINVSRNPRPEAADMAICGDGDDTAWLDFPLPSPISSLTQLRGDGADSDCETITPVFS